MKQTIIKNGRIVCTTTAPYPKDIIKQLKKAGYTIKEEGDKENG